MFVSCVARGEAGGQVVCTSWHPCELSVFHPSLFCWVYERIKLARVFFTAARVAFWERLRYVRVLLDGDYGAGGRMGVMYEFWDGTTRSISLASLYPGFR